MSRCTRKTRCFHHPWFVWHVSFRVCIKRRRIFAQPSLRLLRRTINWWLKERMDGNPTSHRHFPAFIWVEVCSPSRSLDRWRWPKRVFLGCEIPPPGLGSCPSSVSFFYLSEGREKTLLPIEWRVIAVAKSFSFCKLKPGWRIHSLSIIYALRHCVVFG